MSDPTMSTKVYYGIKTVIDFAFFVTIISFLLILDETSSPVGTPRKYQIYKIRPDYKIGEISDFFESFFSDTSVRKMCSPTNSSYPVGCTTSTAFYAELDTVSSCTGADPRPPACTQCIDEYGRRVYEYGSTTKLGMQLYGPNSTNKDETIETYRDELEACVARTGGQRVASKYVQSNIWFHFFLWSAFAVVYSGIIFLNRFMTSNSKDNKNVIWLRYALLVFTLVLAIAFALAHLPRSQGSTFDMAIAILQLFFFSVASMVLLFTKEDKQNEQLEHIDRGIFAIFMVCVAPSIAIIVNLLHSWTEYRMVFGVISILLSFFVFSMMDDMTIQQWPTENAKNIQKKTQSDFLHIHATLMVLMLFSIYLLVSTNLPMAPTGDIYYGQAAFITLVLFLVAFAAGGLLLQEIRTPSRSILSFKMVVEWLFRVIIFSLLVENFRNK